MLLLKRWISRASSQHQLGFTDALSYAAIALITFSVLLQYLIYGLSDSRRCNALLTSGSWPPADDLAVRRQPYEHWEPTGCRMRAYTREDVWECLAKRRLVFIGDSITRQLFFAAGKRLDHAKTDDKMREVLAQGEEAVQQDESLFVEGGVRLDFHWDPLLNSTVLLEEMASFRGEPPGELGGGGEDDPPAIIVLGAPGLWAARDGGDAYFEIFTERIEAIRPHLDAPIASKHRLRTDNPGLVDQIFLAPVQVPDYGRLSEEWANALSPERVNRMNDHLRRLPKRERSRVLHVFNEMTTQAPDTLTHTGLHVTEAAAERWLDIVLNARCNSVLKSDGYENKLTCCKGYPPLAISQWIILLAGLLCVVLTEVRRRGLYPAAMAKFPDVQFSQAALCLSAAACYSSLADRTHLFAKTEKHYSSWSLGFLLFLVLACSFLSGASARRTLPSASHDPQDSEAPDEEYLPRHVSREWAGWMQCVLLLLAFQETGGSFLVHTTIRVFVSAYIFIFVYGHAMYFLLTRDYTIRRAILVLFRINILPLVLDVMPRNHWTLYYWPSLISFWFLGTFALMRVGSRRNADSRFMLLKVSALTITMSLLAPSTTPNINATVNNATELWQHITLDRFMPAAAITAAFVMHRLQTLKRQLAQPGSMPSSSLDPLDRAILAALGYSSSSNGTSLSARLIAICLSCFGILLYITGVRHATDKAFYNAFHPYLSCAAVLSFATLRNCHPKLRIIRLRIPASIGTFSMSRYVLCHHVLLSGDGTGLLRTGMWRQGPSVVSSLGWHLETVSLVIVLFWASSMVHEAIYVLGEAIFRRGDGSTSDIQGAAVPEVELDDFWERTKRFADELVVVGPGRFSS